MRTTVQQKESRWNSLKTRPTITTYKTKSLIEGGFPAVKFHLEGWIYCYQSTPNTYAMERQVVWFPDMMHKRVIAKQVIQEP